MTRALTQARLEHRRAVGTSDEVAWAPTSIAALAVALAVTLTGGAFLWLSSFRLLQHIQRTEGTR